MELLLNRFQFFTRDRKPKLYNLLILTAAVFLSVGILLLTKPEKYILIICITMVVYCLLAVVILLYSFREQIRYNPYSYNTIFYFGFAMFSLFVMITHISLAVRIIRNPDIDSVFQLVFPLLGSAKSYMLFTFPFILIFSAALCVSNVVLIVREGKRIVNLLGIILSVLLVAGEVFLFFFDFSASGSDFEVMMHDMLTNLFAAIYLYFECMIIGTIVANAVVARYEPDKNIDFMIILGCGLRKDGTLTPLLRGRADRAVSFYRKQKEQTGKELVFITSGGQGNDETVSESSAMKNYLITVGIPEERIIEENKSTNTFENMKFSQEIIHKINPDGNVAFSTTNYHVFRSGIWSRRIKMKSVGIGAETKWYFWPNASVREFIGLLTNHIGKQCVILGAMIVFYIILTLIAYQI